MTDHEERQIKADALLKHHEAMQKLRLLEAHARAYAASMRAVAQQLDPLSKVHIEQSAEVLLAEPSGDPLQVYPNLPDVLDVLRELSDARNRVEAFAKVLRDYGVNP